MNSPRKKIRHNQPKKQPTCFTCRDLEEEEINAFKALHKGEADAWQQSLVLGIITNVFSRAHDITYEVGSFDQSAFMAGRAFVGQQILKVVKQPIATLLPYEDESDENTQST